MERLALLRPVFGLRMEFLTLHADHVLSRAGRRRRRAVAGIGTAETRMGRFKGSNAAIGAILDR